MDPKQVPFRHSSGCCSTESDAENVCPTCKLPMESRHLPTRQPKQRTEACRSAAQTKDKIDYPEFVVFVAGSASDPQPLENEFSKRFARDLDCNRIVHFSKVTKKWVYDDGTFHSRCRLEFPAAWLPPGYQTQHVLETEP
jgi:uncharacterized protein YchJ